MVAMSASPYDDIVSPWASIERYRIDAVVTRKRHEEVSSKNRFVIDRETMSSRFRLALIQLAVGADKTTNIRRACQMVKEAVRNGAGMVVLPECFNSTYGTQHFHKNAEPVSASVHGETTQALATVAKECEVYLVGGSIPERAGNKIYNTATAFNRLGQMVAKYCKMHLFDVDVPGKLTFKESETLVKGSELATFDTEYCKVGLGICYDLRFPELALLYAKQGCKMLCYPAAFSKHTGPAHWDLLLRSRALDNQLFVAGVSVTRDEDASYVAWGHSTVVDPWGRMLVQAGEEEDIVYADVDVSEVDSIRQQIPVQSQKRTDVYSLQKTQTHQ